MTEPDLKSTVLDAEAASPNEALQLAGERFVSWQRNFPSYDALHAAPTVCPLGNGRYQACIWVIYADESEPATAPTVA